MNAMRSVFVACILLPISTNVFGAPLTKTTPAQIVASGAPEASAIKERAAADLNRVIAEDKTLFGTDGLEPCPGSPEMLWDAFHGPRQAPSNPDSSLHKQINAQGLIRLGEIAIFMVSGACPVDGRFSGPADFIALSHVDNSVDWNQGISEIDTRTRRTAVYFDGEMVGDMSEFRSSVMTGYLILASGERVASKTPMAPDGAIYSADVSYATYDRDGILLSPRTELGKTSFDEDKRKVFVSVLTSAGPDRQLRLTYSDGALLLRNRLKGGLLHGWSEVYLDGEVHKTCHQEGGYVLSDTCPD